MTKFPFNSSSTAEQVAQTYPNSAKNRKFIITGANTGLGFETARVLAKYGADEVIVLCRGPKLQPTIDKLKELVPQGNFSGFDCQLDDLKNVKACVETIKQSGKLKEGKSVSVICNAGVMGCPKSLTKDGFELQFGVNHLGHFTLVTGILEDVKSSGTKDDPARIINLSSMGHYIFGPRPDGILWNDLNADKSYDEYERYGQSKLANVLFTKGILLENPKEVNDGTLYSMALHPGVIMGTELMRHFNFSAAWSTMKGVWKVGFSGFKLFVSNGNKSIPQGSATTVLCALAPKEELVNGGYYSDGNLDDVYVHPAALIPENAERLWKVSEELISNHV